MNVKSYSPIKIYSNDFILSNACSFDGFKYTRFKSDVVSRQYVAEAKNRGLDCGVKEKNKTSEILKLAVKRMLPGGPLAKKQLTKLKIYNGDKHPHDVQKPKTIEFAKLNKRNIVV